jgi:hypothetical protein
MYHKSFEKVLSAHVIVIPPLLGRQKALLWLISNLLLYLTDFLKRRIRAKTGKISQKYASGTHRLIAFTMFVLTIMSAYGK